MARLLNLGRWWPAAAGRAGKRVTLAPGVYLTRALRLVRPLGASGRVWVAQHGGLTTEVVVKFLSSLDASATQDADRDGSAASALKDPHIVQVFDHGGARAGIPFVVMELLAGESLRERLGRAGPLSLREVRTIVGQTAGALGKAHAAGVVHGRISPDSLFLTDAAGEPFIKILGFKYPPEVRRPGVPAPPSAPPETAYASPEQLTRNAPADPQADLWALAVSIYELLTNSSPFSAPTPQALALAICQGPLKPVTRLRPDLPHAMDAWFARALSKDRPHRYRTASEFAQSFAEAADGHYFVDPDRSGLGEDDDQEEPTALWTQPAWWADEVASAQASATFDAKAAGAPLFAARPAGAFQSSRSAPTMVLRIPPNVAFDTAVPAPVPEPAASPDRPFLFPMAAIWGGVVGVVAALLIWAVQFALPQTGATADAEPGPAPSPTEAPAAPAENADPASDANRVRSSALKPRSPQPSTNEASIAGTKPEALVMAGKAEAQPSPAAKRNTAPSVAPPKTSSRPSARKAPEKRATGANDCDPPYYYDKQQIKRVKHHCL